MGNQRTLCIIKPDAVGANNQGAILQRLLDEGFSVLAMRQSQLSLTEAQGFYQVHAARPFFADLCTFMSRGPVVVIALERVNAVKHYRDIIGATDPAAASDGTLRKLYGKDLSENALHGSDSEENGVIECAYFFSGVELQASTRN